MLREWKKEYWGKEKGRGSTGTGTEEEKGRTVGKKIWVFCSSRVI
jgi:hypothetical protein